MPKKNFKSQVQGADKLFSANDGIPRARDVQDVSDVSDALDVLDASDVQDVRDAPASMVRLTLRIDKASEDYLREAAWQKRVSITDYIRGLITADKEGRS